MLQALIVYVLALVVFVWLLQLALFAYGRGVVRAAIDEGARAGSVVDDAVRPLRGAGGRRRWGACSAGAWART